MFVTNCKASYAPSDDRLSVSGYIRQMVDAEDWRNMSVPDPNGDILPWYNCTSFSSSRQKGVVAQSSTEAEYIAGVETVKMMQHSDEKWSTINLWSNPNVPELFVDNSSMINIAHNWKVSKLTRHISIRFHHIRSRVKQNYLIIRKIHTDHNISDMTTKNLHRPPLEKHRDKIMIGTSEPDHESISGRKRPSRSTSESSKHQKLG